VRTLTKVVTVCAVAQYAVLEANGKVNGIGENSHPAPSKPLDQFGCRCKYITTFPQGVDVQNLIKIDSAVAALCIREKTGFCVVFFCLHPSVYLSICLSVCMSVCLSVYPFFATPTGHIFSAILTLTGSNDVFLQPLVPFGGRDEIAPHLGL